MVAGPGQGAGPARASGMDVGCARLESLGRSDGLLASTDADSTVAPDWIARQLEAVAAGAEAIGGEVILDPDEAAALPPAVLAGREADLAARTLAAAARGPAEHAHFSGASLGVTPRAYRQAGGMAWMAALEDQELEDRLAAAGIQIHRLRPVSVVTAARTEGRASRGLARDLELGRWLVERRYDGADSRSPALLAAKTTRSRRSCRPASARRRSARSSTAWRRCRRRACSTSCWWSTPTRPTEPRRSPAGTAPARSPSQRCGPSSGPAAARATRCGARPGRPMPSCSSSSTPTRVDFDPGFLIGLVGPMLLDPSLALVKGTFHRPLRSATRSAPARGEGHRAGRPAAAEPPLPGARRLHPAAGR